MSDLRLLAFGWMISDHRGGGEPIGAYELLRALAKQGVEADVVTPCHDVRAPLPDAIRVHVPAGAEGPGNSGRNKRAMAKEARALLARHEYDALHVLTQFTAFPILARPFLMSGCYNFPPEGPQPPRPPIWRETLGWALKGSLRERLDFVRNASHALVHERLKGATLADTMREADCLVVRQRVGLDKYPEARRVAWIPFGIDPGLVQPRYGGDGRVLYAGALGKGVDRLLRAFAVTKRLAPDATLLVAGGGSERPQLERLAADLGIAPSVTFLGHVPRPELLQLMREVSVFAIASVETFAQVAMEAMAAGKPAVVSDRITGAHDYVRDGQNGFLVSPWDAEAFGGRIADLLRDPPRAEAMGREARRTAEAFSMERVAREHVALYRELREATAAKAPSARGRRAG